MNKLLPQAEKSQIENLFPSKGTSLELVSKLAKSDPLGLGIRVITLLLVLFIAFLH